MSGIIIYHTIYGCSIRVAQWVTSPLSMFRSGVFLIKKNLKGEKYDRY